MEERRGEVYTRFGGEPERPNRGPRHE